eukprot:16359803-Heterocapsa_arctica.AAC.1
MVQFLLRLGPDPFVLQTAIVVASTNVPKAVFVFVVEAAVGARQERPFLHFRHPDLRPGASCEDVP